MNNMNIKKNESVLKLKDEQKYRDGKSYNGILSFPVFDEVTLLKLLFCCNSVKITGSKIQMDDSLLHKDRSSCLSHKSLQKCLLVKSSLRHRQENCAFLEVDSVIS